MKGCNFFLFVTIKYLKFQMCFKKHYFLNNSRLLLNKDRKDVYVIKSAVGDMKQILIK